MAQSLKVFLMMNVPSNGALGTRRGFMPQNPFMQRTGLRSMFENYYGSDYQPSGFAKRDISNFSFYDEFNRKPDEAAKDVPREMMAEKGVFRGRDRLHHAAIGTDLALEIAAREPNTRRPYDPSYFKDIINKFGLPNSYTKIILNLLLKVCDLKYKKSLTIQEKITCSIIKAFHFLMEALLTEAIL